MWDLSVRPQVVNTRFGGGKVGSAPTFSKRSALSTPMVRLRQAVSSAKCPEINQTA
jgi:hypothetical protein